MSAFKNRHQHSGSAYATPMQARKGETKHLFCKRNETIREARQRKSTPLEYRKDKDLCVAGSQCDVPALEENGLTNKSQKRGGNSFNKYRSEKAYIQELNRYLEEKEIHCILSPAARDFGLSCTRYLL
jgi:hypothetical protein